MRSYYGSISYDGNLFWGHLQILWELSSAIIFNFCISHTLVYISFGGIFIYYQNIRIERQNFLFTE